MFRRLGDYAVQDYFVIEWYSLVGVSFIMTAFYNVLMLPGFAFGFHILGVLRRAMSRCCCRPKHQVRFFLLRVATKKIDTIFLFWSMFLVWSSTILHPKIKQDDLNAIWTLPYFRLSDRYAQCLAMVLVVVTFSAGCDIYYARFLFFCFDILEFVPFSKSRSSNSHEQWCSWQDRPPPRQQSRPP